MEVFNLGMVLKKCKSVHGFWAEIEKPIKVFRIFV